MVTFDDALDERNFPYIETLFGGLKNPGHCGDAHLTYFVSHDYTNYSTVHKFYKQGHEIASHSVTHKSVQWFREGAGASGWDDEVSGQKKNLLQYGEQGINLSIQLLFVANSLGTICSGIIFTNLLCLRLTG